MITEDKDYIEHCINDLNKIKEFLEFMSSDECQFEKMDCIIELLEELKEQINIKETDQKIKDVIQECPELLSEFREYQKGKINNGVNSSENFKTWLINIKKLRFE